MRSIRRLLLVATSGAALLLGAGLPALAQSPAPATASTSGQPSDAWAHENSDIPVDANVRFGTLANGMRYAILKNATPPGQASLRLRIDAGSLMESEDQLGLAHFTEHMLFNGTTNIPENELIRILERLGLAFGADTNAATSFDQTFYQLELPRANDETIDASLRIMREQVSEALMEGEDIDAERGVIVNEERLRNSPGLRSLKAQLALLAPGQRLSSRLPIGDLDVIRSAPRERFVDFYEAYYRPSRATLIAVGDFDVDQMEAKIKAGFESWQPKAADGPEPDLGQVAQREPETSILVEPGIQSSVSLTWVDAPDLAPDTSARRRDSLLRNIGLAILNRRFAEMAQADNPPFIGASASATTPFFDSLGITSIDAAFNPGGVNRALEAIEQEARRLAEFGVTEAEIEREVVNGRTARENAVAAAATRTTPSLANGLLSSINDDGVFSAPATNLALFNAAVEGITPAQINDAAKTAFTGQGPLALVVTPLEIEGGEAAVTAALEASTAMPVTARAAQAAIEWPYTAFGTAGAETERREIAELGATIVSFSNGVTLTVKPTTFRDEQILVSVQTGNGALGLPTDNTSVIRFAPSVFTQGGLGKLTADEVSRALAGKIYSAGFGIGDDSYSLTGATRPQDLNLQMQVMAAYFTDAGLRQSAFEREKAQWPQVRAQQDATPIGVLQASLGELLSNGDKREATPSVEEVAGWTVEDLRASLAQGLAAGPIEIVMVGDVTVDDAVASVASTFAALPERAATPAPLPGSDQRRFPAATTEPVRLTHTGPAEQALAMIAWPSADAVEDATEARVVSILASVMNLRGLEEIREKQGLAYAVQAASNGSDVFEDYGAIFMLAPTQPESLPGIFTAVDAITASLRDTPISDDELMRARQPVIEAIRLAQAGNGYWLGQLFDVATDPSTLEQIQTETSDLEAITPADIQRAAQAYLQPDKAWRLEIVSANPATPAAPTAAAPPAQ